MSNTTNYMRSQNTTTRTVRVVAKPKVDPVEIYECKNDFAKTRDMFRNFLGWDRDISYEQFIKLDLDHQVAALYVQFYQQITLAYFKAKSFYTDEQEAVSTVLQYLFKNVKIITEVRSRFSAPYIYKVAYNCLYCISHDRKCDKDRYEFEMSNICTCSDTGDELDLFDTVVDNEDMTLITVREHFWKVIEDMGEDAMTVVEYLLNGGRLPAGMKSKQDAIMDQLREQLAQFKDILG